MKRRSVRETSVFSVVSALLLALLVLHGPNAAGAAAADGQGECGGATATIVGTPGNDVLRGTSGDDVIDAGDGDDTVLGGGGNDLICGGSGNDRVLGEGGHDTLIGGPGNDILVGGPGNDRLFGQAGDDTLVGEDGDDLLVGGDGADRMDGGPGADRIAGGSGDDALAGSNGDDYLSGGPGFDRGAGGGGIDTCTQIEASGQCERSASGDPDPGMSVAITSPPADTTVAGATTVIVQVQSTSGVEAVELLMDGQVVGSDFRPTGPGTATRTFSVDFTSVRNGPHRLDAVVMDRNGETTTSATVWVVVANEVGPEGPSTGLVFQRPVPLSEIEPVLRANDVRVIEFFHEHAPLPPVPLSADLTRLIETEGVAFVQPAEAFTGGFYGRGLDTSELLGLYRDAYQQTFPGEEPLILGLRVEGTVGASALGALAPNVLSTVPVAPRQSFSAAGARSAALAGEDPSRTSAPKTGARTESEATTGRTALQAASGEPSPWWPTFGQFNTKEYKLGRSFFPPRLFEEKRVTFVHDLVWTPAALASFDGADRAYEHDFKTFSPGRIGTRPACLNPFSEDNFYAYRTGLIWASTIPGRAAPYLDTDVSDSCSIADLTVGIGYPEKLDDGLAAGTAVAHRIAIDTKRGSRDEGSFDLVAQSLDRQAASCERFPRQLIYLCIGINAGLTRGAPIIRTDGVRIPGIKLPACVVWKWLPVGSADGGPDVVNRCGADRDGDGYDDSIDCAPNDPTINPGAVDIPNDGIDQNCDGADLVVGTGKVQVTLIWDNEVDMDLHVFEPNGTEIWYASPGPTATGGRLDRDDNVCGTPNRGPGGVENVFWPNDVNAPTGTYRVQVVEYGRCGQPVANWILEIRVNGNLVKRETGAGGGFSTTFNA